MSVAFSVWSSPIHMQKSLGLKVRVETQMDRWRPLCYLLHKHGQ